MEPQKHDDNFSQRNTLYSKFLDYFFSIVDINEKDHLQVCDADFDAWPYPAFACWRCQALCRRSYQSTSAIYAQINCAKWQVAKLFGTHI
jgi:hypothetical protein